MARILWLDDYAGKGSKRRMGFDALIYFVEQNGHAVEIVSTRKQIELALEKIDTYDLFILDIIMDSLSFSSQSEHQFGGIDVLEKLAKSRSKIPIIILSVMPPKVIKEEAIRRGLDIKKIGVVEIRRKGSITPSQLATYVERHLLAKANLPNKE